MSNKLAFGLGLVVGALSGATSAWIFAQKKYQRISEEEITSVRETYKEMQRELHQKNLRETSEKDIYTEISAQYVTEEEPEPEFATTSIIDVEEFGVGEDFDVDTLYYYNNVDDGVLVDTRMEPVNKNLVFGNNADDILETLVSKHDDFVNDNVMYVRNRERKIDFEILLNESENLEE